MRRRSLLAASTAVLAACTTLLPASPAHAGLADVWTTYPGMASCKSGLVHLVQLNNYCYGLKDGRAIGLLDASLAVDELDQTLGTYYDDENTLPAPEGPGNPVVEVWNNTGIYTFLGAGTSLAHDAATGAEIYNIPPGADLKGAPVDADAGDLENNHLFTGPVVFVTFEAGTPADTFEYGY